MKLLQINTVNNSGSTGRIAEDIGQIVKEAGWESYIAYGRETNRPSQSKKIRIGSNWDVNFHGLLTRILDNHSLGLSSRHSTKKFVTEIKHIKPDIIHLHNLHGYYLNIEILFNFLSTLDTPIVWTFHDCWPFTGHCANFDYIGCKKWETACYDCPLTKSYPASYIIDRSKRNYEEKKRLFNLVNNMTLIPASNWLGDFLNNSFFNDFHVRMIHNGIDTSKFRPRESNTIINKYNLQGKFVILGVASEWSFKKGFQDFIKINDMIGCDFQIILVGLSHRQIELLPNNIIGITHTESVDELAQLYAVADVFINPTYEDNFPTTNIEALACGTPVITYKTGGSPESLDLNTGIVVEKGNKKGIVDAIYEIKTKGKISYTDACRNRALLLYKKEDRYMDYLTLYENLINR